MATVIMMKSSQTGVTKKGFHGFSWTTLLFGGIPALFRGDIITGLVVIILGLMTFQITSIIWAFMYNKRYTVSLLEKGYEFVGNDHEISRAKSAVGIF